MWRHIVGDLGSLCCLLNNLPGALAAQPAAPQIQEDGMGFPAGQRRTRAHHIFLVGMQGGATDWHNTFFIAFSVKQDGRVVDIQITDVEASNLGDASSRGVQQLEQCTVA